MSAVVDAMDAPPTTSERNETGRRFMSALICLHHPLR